MINKEKIEKFLDTFTDLKSSLIASAVIHLLLLVIFLFVSVGINFKAAEFTEVSFVSSGKSYSRSTVEAPKKTQTPPVAATARPPEVKATEQPKAPPTNLPKRRMLEDTEPELTNKRTGKLAPEVRRPDLDSRTDYDRSSVSQSNPGSSTIGERITATPSRDIPDEGAATAAAASAAGSANRFFTIEGDAADRNILSQVIPQYPSGLQKEAVVKIRFSVLPDGSIGQMIPMQKGDPVLEEITLKALRKWRFNPLPGNADQKTVMGIITFRYELQ